METYSELVESLENCVAVCNNCAASCLNEDNMQSMADCIRLDLDCADICQLTLKLLARDSKQMTSAVELCRDICAECAAECGKHEYDHCQLCADSCRRCEDLCKRYLEKFKATAATI